MMPDRPADDREDVFELVVSEAELVDAADAGACPEANALASFADGGTPDGDSAEIVTHLSLCASCRRIVAALSSPRSDTAGGDASAPPAAEPDPSAFPRTFGAYLLRRRIGGGGMGDVFEAEHRDRGRREALKQLRAGLDADPRAAERFLREVRAVANARHDHVVPVFDSGSVDGVLYFTMPLLPGPSLARLVEEVRATGEAVPARGANAVLDRHGLPPSTVAGDAPEVAYARRVAAALAGVARALEAIHGAGMVHRDVKPSNVLFDDRRRAVLGDFGLAHLDGSSLTRTTETLGTPAYMAPEQLVGGGSVDARADVYGLGATLYEMLTLHRPYDGRSVAETVALIQRGGAPPARTWNPRVPHDVAVIVGRCLETRPADRYADAGALARDLEAFARAEPIEARPLSSVARAARAVARRRRPLAIAAALLLAAGAWAYVRPGHLTVEAVPAASLQLDGEDVGTTPLRDRSLAAGDHVVVLRRDRFAPATRQISLGRGETYSLDVVLRALDPADPETLRLLASERGVERTEVTVAADRAPAPGARLAVLFPRGALREPPSEVLVWAEAPLRDVSVRLEREDAREGDDPLARWDVATAFRSSSLAVPASARRGLAAGAYRVRIVDRDGQEGIAASFDMLSSEAAANVESELRAVAKGFEPDDPAAEFLRADRLLARGLFVEALAAAHRLRVEVGDRKEPARLALAALDRAGLRDVGPWFEWASIYLRAER